MNTTITNTTTLSNMIDPQVMGDMINARLASRIALMPYVKVDDTLLGAPGSTITIPRYSYIGKAVTLAENTNGEYKQLTSSDVTYKVHKVWNGVTLTDEAVLSGYGDPVGQANNQLGKSVFDEMDDEIVTALYQGNQFYENTTSKLGYNAIVEGIDVFDEEFNSEKVMFIHPKQLTDLRKDSNFLDRTKYTGSEVMVTGEIGKIANTSIVVSKRVKSFSTWYSFTTEGTSGALTIIASGTPTASQVLLADVIESLPNAEAGDLVLKNTTKVYFNPIIKITWDAETEDELPAVTMFPKRNAMVESERDQDNGTTKLAVNAHFTMALTDATKTVLCKLKA